jgi:cobalt/nickel transport protein
MWKIACMAVALLMCLSGRAEAQFSMLIPSSSTVMEDKESSLKLDVFSAYPMEMRGLDMQQPKSLTITRDGKVEDLKAMLKPATIIGHQAWRAVYEVKQPGVYQFAMEPAPISIPRKTASSSTIPRLSWLLLATRKAGMFLWG